MQTCPWSGLLECLMVQMLDAGSDGLEMRWLSGAGHGGAQDAAPGQAALDWLQGSTA